MITIVAPKGILSDLAWRKVQSTKKTHFFQESLLRNRSSKKFPLFKIISCPASADTPHERQQKQFFFLKINSHEYKVSVRSPILVSGNSHRGCVSSRNFFVLFKILRGCPMHGLPICKYFAVSKIMRGHILEITSHKRALTPLMSADKKYFSFSKSIPASTNFPSIHHF